MDYYTFIGLLVVALGVLVGLFFAVHKPLVEIATRLTKIETQLDTMNKTLEGHSNTLSDHEKRIGKNEQDITVLKKTKKKGY